MNIKKGDNVIVLAGKDRGKSGKVLRVLPAVDRVIVEGVNLRWRRIRPRRAGEKGQTVEKAEPLHMSNVALWCQGCKKGVRFRRSLDTKGKKQRLCAKCGKAL